MDSSISYLEGNTQEWWIVYQVATNEQNRKTWEELQNATSQTFHAS